MLSYFRNISQLHLCSFLVLLLFIFCIIALYPGGMSPDSYHMFQQSIFGISTVHHSPVIIFTWKILNNIHCGPLVMLIFEQVILWLSVLVFINTWYKKNGPTKEMFIFLFVPFIPSILVLNGMIWKDVIFAFSYLLAASLLTRYTMLREIKPNFYTKIVIAVIIFFGSAAKFQAMYVAPIMIFWYLFICFDLRIRTSLILSIMISIALIFSIPKLNHHMVKDDSGKARFGWQLIRYYDLLYISHAKNINLLPDYIKENPNFIFEEVNRNYDIDTAVNLFQDRIITTSNPVFEQQIIDSWYKAVTKYPFSYLSARSYLLGKILSNPSYNKLTGIGISDTHKILEGRYNLNFQNNLLTRIVNIYLKKLTWITPFAFCIAFVLLYLLFGIKSYLKFKSNYALVTIFMCLTIILFISIMFFVMVARDYRFFYICHVFFHFSHPFAWRSIREYYKYKSPQPSL